MTLRQKREIVLAFKAGEDMAIVAANFKPSGTPWLGPNLELVEQVIRSYVNGKFKLEKKK